MQFQPAHTMQSGTEYSSQSLSQQYQHSGGKETGQSETTKLGLMKFKASFTSNPKNTLGTSSGSAMPLRENETVDEILAEMDADGYLVP